MKKNNSHYKEAMNLIKSNNVSDAVDELKLCLKFNSNSVSALNLLGLAYYLKCRFDKAEKTWRKSLSIKNDNNKARDYLELITKKDFSEIRKEYKNTLFNDKTNQNMKIKFLKSLIERYDELIEPYVILGLLYKKEENYDQALKYFYKAYDLDSGNQNIKNYIKQCEKEDEVSNVFNLKSQTNKKSVIIAGVIAVSLFAFFLNLSGVSPIEWIGKNIDGFEFAESKNENNSTDSSDLSTQNNNNQDNSNDNSVNNNAQLDVVGKLDLMEYQAERAFLSFENIKKLKEKENRKEELSEASTFLEEGTEQQLFNLGMDYFSRGDYQNASEIFKSIYNLTETDYLKRESLFLLARSYEKLLNYKSAEHYYRIYLNEYEDSNYYIEALYNLGLMLDEAGLEKKSKEILQRLRTEAPYSKYNNSHVYDILN
jgi:tetratricopeptide (TPR) repeat protein